MFSLILWYLQLSTQPKITRHRRSAREFPLLFSPLTLLVSGLFVESWHNDLMSIRNPVIRCIGTFFKIIAEEHFSIYSILMTIWHSSAWHVPPYLFLALALFSFAFFDDLGLHWIRRVCLWYIVLVRCLLLADGWHVIIYVGIVAPHYKSISCCLTIFS